MPVGTSNGEYFEDQFDYEHQKAFGASEKQPLKITITPHMNAGESEQGVSGGGLTEPKEVQIVRHGETQANDTDTVRGQDPIPLNENGRAEAEKAADKLKAKGVDTIVASDLKRSRETAEIIGKKLGITPVYDRRLRTWDVGDHTGQPCKTSNPILKEYAQNKQDEPVPGGESFNEFQERSFAGIRDAVLNNKDKNLAIITHNRVEATLKGWEKTGQDNPDIDYNEVVKEETEPGTVRPMKFEPGATILNTFNERFEPAMGLIAQQARDQAALRLGTAGSPKFFPKEDVRGRQQYELDKSRGFDSVESDYQSLPNSDPTYKPMSERLPGILGPMADIASQKDIGSPRHTKEEFESYLRRRKEEGASNNQIARESDIEPRKMTRILESLGLKSEHQQYGSTWTKEQDDKMFQLLYEDKSYSQIAKELGVSRGAVAGRISRWYKNFSEGGPVEGEKETIRAAAMRHPTTGKVYEGYAHFNAVEKAGSEDYTLKDAYNIPWEEGFTTNTGRFVDRAEAARIHGHASLEDVSPASRAVLENRPTGKYGHDKLISEDVPKLRADKRSRQKPMTREDMNDLIKGWEDIVNKSK